MYCSDYNWLAKLDNLLNKIRKMVDDYGLSNAVRYEDRGREFLYHEVERKNRHFYWFVYLKDENPTLMVTLDADRWSIELYLEFNKGWDNTFDVDPDFLAGFRSFVEPAIPLNHDGNDPLEPISEDQALALIEAIIADLAKP